MISGLIAIGAVIAIVASSSGTTHGMEIPPRQGPEEKKETDKY